MRGVSWAVAAAVAGLLCAGTVYSQVRAPAPPPAHGHVKAAPKILPILMPVYADKEWQDTGVYLDGKAEVDVVYQGGFWQTLPDQDARADGYNFLAPDGYVLPVAPAGSLVGVVVGPGGGVFSLAHLQRVPDNLRGELYLIANDDIDRKTGTGFSDNKGFVLVRVFVSTP